MNRNKIAFLLISFFSMSAIDAQVGSVKGKLFIIGGGDRPPSLLKSLVNTADLQPDEYIVILPMSGESPDTSYYYIKSDLQTVCNNYIANFNFTKESISKKSWLDSLEKAKLIFITGGDQSRFMNIVWNSPVYASIHKAYKNGATIAGTSAGAAVMSKYMITGNELSDTTYRATFRKIINDNIEIREGLGLLPGALIDQHFIVRSRYNRLLSAIAKFPNLSCIGIDEETAIIVQGNSIVVSGTSQVIVFRKPIGLSVTPTGLIKFTRMQCSMYTGGDRFTIGN